MDIFCMDEKDDWPLRSDIYIYTLDTIEVIYIATKPPSSHPKR